MGMDWYDMIALRNGGYKGRSTYTWEGQSAEDIFEERLIRLFSQYQSVLDAGCGDGDFTLRMSAHTRHITGFDNSKELLHIAQAALEAASVVNNVEFVYATTKTEVPFESGQFDLIYDRRGPTSIIEHGRVLRSGGMIFGIHTDVSKVKERLLRNRYEQIEIEEFNEAFMIFPNEQEFALFLSDVPGNPDYTLPGYREQLQVKIREHHMDGKIAVREHKYIWKAVKTAT